MCYVNVRIYEYLMFFFLYPAYRRKSGGNLLTKTILSPFPFNFLDIVGRAMFHLTLIHIIVLVPEGGNKNKSYSCMGIELRTVAPTILVSLGSNVDYNSISYYTYNITIIYI